MGSVQWDAIGGGLLGQLFDAEENGPDFGDRYEQRGTLGSGGQGVVYRCWDRSCEREVAIKRLRDPGANQLPLRSEARLLTRLAHPAIPQIYDIGRGPDGGLFVAMQFIDGRRLGEVVRDPELSLAARLHLFRAVAGAVQHSHARGILHRDLKPENVLVTPDNEPYLVDWGLAAHGGPRAICGSPHFAAPEQLEGQVADQRSDIYALGVLLYVILSKGALPYGRKVRDFHEFRQLRAGLSQVPLRERDPSLPAALERIATTAMAPQPGGRYRSVRALLRDLDAFEQGRPLARDLPALPWRRLGGVFAVAASLALGIFVGRLGPSGGTAPVIVPAPLHAAQPAAPSSGPAEASTPSAALSADEDRSPSWPDRLVFRPWPVPSDRDAGGVPLRPSPPLVSPASTEPPPVTGGAGPERELAELLVELDSHPRTAAPSRRPSPPGPLRLDAPVEGAAFRIDDWLPALPRLEDLESGPPPQAGPPAEQGGEQGER